MRKHFLIKPKLQLTHLVWNLGVVFLASTIGYLLFESVIDQTLVHVTIEAPAMESLREYFRAGFGLIVFILIIGIGIENYLFFHRIVGPLYALEKGMKRLAEGNFTEAVHIRESDELRELIAGFEEVKRQLQYRMEAHEKIARLLAHELDLVLKNATPKNIEILQEKLKQIREEVLKKAA